ncbi:MAG: hypothetical protein AAF763_07025 [Pseudomonadota bacterium]
MKILSVVVALSAMAAFASPASAYSCSSGGGEPPHQSVPGTGA